MVAQVKPLKLKVEKSSTPLASVIDRPFVEVLVKVPFLSLEEIFTYSLPTGCETIEPGFLVSVEFGHHHTQGVVVARSSAPSSSGKIRAITSQISHTEVFSSRQIDLALTLSRRYLSSAWDFLDSTAPSFSPLGEKAFLKEERAQAGEVNIDGLVQLPSTLARRLREDALIRDLLILPTLSPGLEILAAVAFQRSVRGKVIVILPDEKEMQGLHRIFNETGIAYTELSSHQKKSDRFLNYLKANQIGYGIVTSLRNGIFLDVGSQDTIIVYNEVERHHYERSSPTWNTRDVALVRSREGSVVFLSHSPSLELVRQAEAGWLTKFIFPQKPLKRLTFLRSDGSQPTFHQIVRKGLTRGNVLISVAKTGYINSVACRKCKNIAECECGGHLQIPSTNSHIRCALCGKERISWSCAWCSSTQMKAISRGAERTASEFGRAFPGHHVMHSSGDKQVRFIESENTLVVATPGSEPLARYEAIVVLDAERMYSHIELRSQEEARAHWFNLLSLLSSEGEAYFSLLPSEEISQGLIRSTAYDLALRELHERERVQLPPFTRLLIVNGAFHNIDNLAALLKSRDIPAFLIDSADEGKGRLLVKIPVERSDESMELLSSVIRIGIAKKEESLSFIFDPFSMN